MKRYVQFAQRTLGHMGHINMTQYWIWSDDQILATFTYCVNVTIGTSHLFIYSFIHLFIYLFIYLVVYV